ncbi:polyketide cyclase/dehydrase [SAR86 cluster bacterium SAR86E]|uniref:Polyketide cyclase/dehydrase n=1 Tax=SAR86 cluster bacterium SAR86E TaxID=1208365 RepID=K6GGY2_9GAMM|nr:polyketide cyclase/dehydrase [SAR86 cluster bacterium SAR86E]
MAKSFEGSQTFQSNPDKILSLINNFEAYRDFLPGCLESTKINETEDGMVSGRLVFSVLKNTYTFESTNKTKGLEVTISQSQGPFLDFYAHWSLEPIDSKTTTVKFRTEFNLPFFLDLIAKQSLVNQIGQKFMRAFKNQLFK